MRKGDIMVGEKTLLYRDLPNHHAADRRGRMYLCGCMRTVKLEDRVLSCGQRRTLKHHRWAGR